ncbi:MAG TPA: hypothetical protein VK190_04620 [Pseudoneobacillus sp.]|nr:hypothetical protein [Pseudoneobacillus sp.]
MKITINPAPQPDRVPARFNAGDYFTLERQGCVRQIVRITSYEYIIIDPEDGQKSIARVGKTADEIVKIYVDGNGPVRKLKVKEIIFESTNDTLTKEDVE